MKKFGIFAKVFLYTALILALVIAIAIGLFYQQFAAIQNTRQMQLLRMDYQGLYEQLHGAMPDREKMLEIAQRFSDGNQSFAFRIMGEGETPVLFSTNRGTPPDEIGTRVLFAFGDYTLIAENPPTALSGNDLWLRLSFAVVIILAISLISAAVFARKMTKPLKSLVGDTKMMSQLLPVKSPKKRNDEIGDLSHDVHHMYDKLKDTIGMLEEENLRRKEMEESQRYFFAAASHELKTPIAATRVVLEGMLAGVGDYGNHPKYLRECIKLMDDQSKAIYEILDIVNLDGDFEPAHESIMISKFVSEQLAALRPMTESGGLDVAADIPDELTCYADPRLLKKAMSNIILNALQNTPQHGQIRISAESVPECDCECEGKGGGESEAEGGSRDESGGKSGCGGMNGGIRLAVLNTGHIDEDLLPRIFEPFYRVDKARGRANAQTGLGLTIVKKSLELMGADFGINNTKNGVLFWLKIKA